jgi:magnesium transporter
MRLLSMINPLYLPEIREMLAEQDSSGLQEFCEALHPARTADFMEGLTAAEAWQVLNNTSLEQRVEVFNYFEPTLQTDIVEQMDRKLVAEVVSELAPDDRVDLLNRVEPHVVEELLPLLPSEERRDILHLRSYPEETAGAVMTTEVAKLSEHLTPREALEQVQRFAQEVEVIYYLYIVDEQDHLRGLVSFRNLVSSLAKENVTLGDIMETGLVTAKVSDDQEEVAETVARYDLLAIPVVDEQHRILGIITHDDIIDVVREEATEDAHRSAAVEPLDESYLRTDLSTLVWKRGIWLFVLFLAALLTAWVLQHYDESVLRKFTWLAFFIPLVISSGGNSGNQSATLVITGLRTGDIEISDWLKVMRRELVMGLVLGSALALCGYFAAWMLEPQASVTRATLFVMPLTVVSVVICGALVGSVLPLIFERIGLDPALMSNPFVAGIIDIVGIVIYMEVALWLLPGI